MRICIFHKKFHKILDECRQCREEWKKRDQARRQIYEHILCKCMSRNFLSFNHYNQSLITKSLQLSLSLKYLKEVDKEEKFNYLMCFTAKRQGRQVLGWQQLQKTWHRQRGGVSDSKWSNSVLVLITFNDWVAVFWSSGLLSSNESTSPASEPMGSLVDPPSFCSGPS